MIRSDNRQLLSGGGPVLPSMNASRKVDDISRHESKHDIKHLPGPIKPLDAGGKPRTDQKQGGKPVPKTYPKP